MTRFGWRDPGLAWIAVAGGLVIAALVGALHPPALLDWQPARALQEPWRAVTAIGVHYGAAHRDANLAGAALVGALGWAGRVPAPIAVAWLVAWPLTHLALGLRPELRHYGGLSGVLHAGVAAVAVFLLATGTRGQRAVGAVLSIGLVAKSALEAPWGAVAREWPGWGFAVAPLAHATGLAAGALCAGVAVLAGRWRGHRPDRSGRPAR